MKKKIAVILICSFIMSAAACAQSKESSPSSSSRAETTQTTTEATTESKEETTVTTSETTELTTTTEETTEETTTTEEETSEETTTSETAAVTPTPVPKKEIKIEQSLTNLSMRRYVDEKQYAAMDPVDQMVKRVGYTRDAFEIQNKDFNELKEKVNAILDKNNKFCEEKYKVVLEALLKDVSNQSQLREGYSTSRNIVARNDDQIFSFRADTSWWQDGQDGFADRTDGEKYYNFLSKTGEEITLDDVIKDKDSFCEYIRKVFDEGNDYYGMSDESRKEMLEGLIKSIQNGSVHFLLTYDGITLYYEYYMTHIGAFQCADSLNMQYFLNTPKNYFIESDFTNTITWDIDGDGLSDTIYVVRKYGNEDVFEIHVGDVVSTYNDPSAFAENELPDGESSFYLAHTDKGFYILASSYCGSDDSFDQIFYVKKDLTTEYVEGASRGYDDATCTDILHDPNQTRFVPADEMYSRNSFGMADCYSSFTLTGTRDEKRTDAHYFVNELAAVITKTDISCKVLSGEDSWKESTLKKGETVAAIGYIPETKELIVNILKPDSKENTRARILMDGVEIYDLFEGIVIGG